MAQAISPNGIPYGTIIAYGGENASDPPTGWVYCDGSGLSSANYPNLYAAIGTSWGGNSTTFLVPDLRGYFLRGVDDGAGVDPDAQTRLPSTSTNGGNSGDNVGSLQLDQVGPFTLGVPTNYSTAGANQTNPFLTGYNMNTICGGYLGGSGNIQSGSVPLTNSTSESRAKNKYVYFFICADIQS